MNLVCFGLLFMLCSPAGTPPPSQVTVAVCPVTAPWSADFQKRANTARRRANDPDLDAVYGEAISLRDQARACRARGGAITH